MIQKETLKKRFHYFLFLFLFSCLEPDFNIANPASVRLPEQGEALLRKCNFGGASQKTDIESPAEVFFKLISGPQFPQKTQTITINN